MLGRPSDYTRELAEAICERIAAGSSLSAICRDEGFPPESTVRRWALDDRDGFSAKYARARDLQLEHHEDRILELGDEVLGTENNAAVSAARLASDNRKWIMSKLKPHRYGDKVQVGGDADNPLKVYHQVNYVIVDPKEPSEG